MMLLLIAGLFTVFLTVGMPVAFALLPPAYRVVGALSGFPLLVISATSMLTAQFGVRAAHALPTGTLRRVFAVLLYALAAYMLWRGVGG